MPRGRPGYTLGLIPNWSGGATVIRVAKATRGRDPNGGGATHGTLLRGRCEQPEGACRGTVYATVAASPRGLQRPARHVSAAHAGPFPGALHQSAAVFGQKNARR